VAETAPQSSVSRYALENCRFVRTAACRLGVVGVGFRFFLFVTMARSETGDLDGQLKPLFRCDDEKSVLISMGMSSASQ
jgi:hypothetical protein